MKYRKKPVVVEAFQFGRDTFPDWFNEAIDNEDVFIFCGMVRINTREGRMLARGNDYIIKGVQGEIYPCNADIFEKTYEEELNHD